MSFMIDLNLKPFGQRVHDRRSHAVQTAGDLVSPAAEFSSRMEDRKYNLHCRKSCLMIDPYRDSTAIVTDRDRVVFIDIHLDLVAITCKRFIHRVVYDLIDKMVKPPCGGTADVHTRSFSYRFQPLQDLNLVRPIFRIKFRT